MNAGPGNLGDLFANRLNNYEFQQEQAPVNQEAVGFDNRLNKHKIGVGGIERSSLDDSP